MDDDVKRIMLFIGDEKNPVTRDECEKHDLVEQWTRKLLFLSSEKLKRSGVVDNNMLMDEEFLEIVVAVDFSMLVEFAELFLVPV